MNYSSRFWLYAPFCTFLTLAAIAMAHWWIVAGAFEKKLAAMKGHQAVPGIALDWDSVDVGGFPFRLDADFLNFRVQGAGAHGPFAWKTEKFALHALTYGRDQSVYEAAGHQELLWTSGNGVPGRITFVPGTLRASSIQDGRGLRRFDLDIVDLANSDFMIGRFQFHLRRDPDGKDLDLMVKADGMRRMTPANVQAYVTLNRIGALAPLLHGQSSWPQATAAWRAQGGTAKLSQVIAPGVDLDKALSPLY